MLAPCACSLSRALPPLTRLLTLLLLCWGARACAAQLAGTTSTYEVRLMVTLQNVANNQTVDTRAGGWKLSATTGNPRLIDNSTLKLVGDGEVEPSCYTCDAGYMCPIGAARSTLYGEGSPYSCEGGFNNGLGNACECMDELEAAETTRDVCGSQIPINAQSVRSRKGIESYRAPCMSVWPRPAKGSHVLHFSFSTIPWEIGSGDVTLNAQQAGPSGGAEVNHTFTIRVEPGKCVCSTTACLAAPRARDVTKHTRSDKAPRPPRER